MNRAVRWTVRSGLCFLVIYVAIGLVYVILANAKLAEQGVSHDDIDPVFGTLVAISCWPLFAYWDHRHQVGMFAAPPDSSSAPPVSERA